jgi:hypothetical protein
LTDGIVIEGVTTLDNLNTPITLHSVSLAEASGENGAGHTCICPIDILVFLCLLPFGYSMVNGFRNEYTRTSG